MPMRQGDDDGDGGLAVSEMVEQPAKVMRIGTMIKQLLEEVRAAPLDDASRNRLRDIHAASIRELEEGLAPELREELERITLPFTEGETPSDAELRIAQAQLVGWLEGVFHGIQTALFAQQMAARAQLEDVRRKALPGGHQPGRAPAGRRPVPLTAPGRAAAVRRVSTPETAPRRSSQPMLPALSSDGEPADRVLQLPAHPVSSPAAR